MKFGFESDSSYYIVAADTLQEFEEFKLTVLEESSAQIADIVEMLTNPDLQHFKVTPIIISEEDFPVVAQNNSIALHSIVELKRFYDTMMEMAALKEAEENPDRRTLQEALGLVDDDPWSKLTDEQKEANRQDAERMQKVRDSGGLTGDSFGGSVSDKTNVHGVKVTVDSDKNVTDVAVNATKSEITPYEFIVEGDFDLTELFDEMRIPENRIEEQEDGRAIVRFHDFQIKTIERILEGRGVTFSLNAISEGDDGSIKDFVIGHEKQHIFYSAVIASQPLSDVQLVIDAVGCGNLILASHEIEGNVWLVCAFNSEAEALVAAFQSDNIDAQVVATNRNGRAIIGAGAASDIKIIDTKVDIAKNAPRPWNERAAEIATMTEEETKAYVDSYRAGEFLFAAEAHPTHRTLIYFTPETHFRETDVMWEGEMPIERLASQGGIKHLEKNIYTMHYDYDLAIKLLCSWGFAESILLHLHINELRSDEAANEARS